MLYQLGEVVLRNVAESDLESNAMEPKVSGKAL